ncbi:MAG: ABC transporter permease subunit [Treponema sp.]|nr:ABC transporter permease subunit [Treponema sp.]
MKFDFAFTGNTILACLKALPVTIEIVAIVLFFSLLFGFLIAAVRQDVRQNEKRLLSRVLSLYVSFIRGTPFMVQTYLFYIAVPTVIQKIIFEHKGTFNVNVIKGTWYAHVLLIFYFTAIISEMFRSGLLAIDKGQMEAALSIGLTKLQAYKRIVIPQVTVHCLPVLCTYVTGLVKMSSLAFTFGVMEITAVAKNSAARNLAYVEAYSVIAILYIVLNLSIEGLFKYIEHCVHQSVPNAA